MYGYITHDKLNMLACYSREQAYHDLILVITSCSAANDEEAKRLIDKHYKEIELEYTEVS